MGSSMSQDQRRQYDGKRAVRQGAGIDRCVLAGRQLPLGRPDLSLRQPAAQAIAHKGTHQAAAPRPLGNDARFELHLRSPEPADQEARPRHDLHHRPRAWRARAGRERLPRGDLQRGLSEHFPRRRGHEAPVHPILLPGRHPEPRCAGDAGFNSRRRRTRLRPLARLRCGLRQPRPDRRLRRRRRRSGDRTAGNELAFQQVPEPGDRRGGFADPPPQRLQDCQSLRSRPHQP